MTIEELIKISDPHPWEYFEIEDTGIRVIERIKFRMRVGLHMGKSTQALMTEGHFVRMRAAPQFNKFDLRILDTKYPQECLYGGGWRPLKTSFSEIHKIILRYQAKEIASIITRNNALLRRLSK